MIVIALTGLMRAGKDSVADILVRDHGFVKMAFAAPLKRMVKNLNPIVGYGVHLSFCDFDECDDSECVTTYAPVYLQDLYDRGWSDEEIKASEFGDEARRYWQRFGTDVMRAEQDDYWIEKAKADLIAAGHERVVFTDCRFPNEADMIHELGNVQWWDSDEAGEWAKHYQTSVWQIVRPGVERQEGAHVSEQNVGLMGEDITIHNDGTLEELAEPVGTALRIVTGEDLPEQGWVQELFKGEK